MSNDEQNRDAFDILAGKLLGSGIHRQVFQCKLLPDFVVKMETVDDSRYRSFANVHEWGFWEKCKFAPKLAQWLAPVEWISPGAWIILQRRCEPIPKGFKFPDKLPAFLTDIKESNFGLLDGRLVCHDYALTIDNPSLKMVRAHWTS